MENIPYPVLVLFLKLIKTQFAHVRSALKNDGAKS